MLAFLLAGCLSPRPQDWPDSLPKRHLFVAAWQADHINQRVQTQEEYLGWVKSFYTGTVIYPRGWLNIQTGLSERAEPQLRLRLAGELERLGVVISAEWAKSNRGRVIDSNMLSIWGSILQMSQLNNQEFEALDRITDDVSLLLEGVLKKYEIVESRYASPLGIETFGGF